MVSSSTQRLTDTAARRATPTYESERGAEHHAPDMRTFLEICEHFVSIGKEINSVLERFEHRSSPQVQQKGPSCDGPIWWFEIAGEGFEPPTFGLLSQKFDWTLLSFQLTDCRPF